MSDHGLKKGGTSSRFSSTQRVATRRTEALPSQETTQKEQGAMGSGCTGRGFILVLDRNFLQ